MAVMDRILKEREIEAGYSVMVRPWLREDEDRPRILIAGSA